MQKSDCLLAYCVFNMKMTPEICAKFTICRFCPTCVTFANRNYTSKFILYILFLCIFVTVPFSNSWITKHERLSFFLYMNIDNMDFIISAACKHALQVEHRGSDYL